MKLKDIKPGAKYAVAGAGSGVTAEEVRSGAAGTLVEVVAIGSFSWVPGECGRHEIIEVPERSEQRIWVKFDATVKRGDEEKVVEQNRLLDSRDVLMPEREWVAKNKAHLREKRRIEQAVKAHEAAKSRAWSHLRKLLGIPSTRANAVAIDERWIGHTRRRRNGVHVQTIEVDVASLTKALRGKAGHSIADAIEHLCELEAKPLDEVTC